MKTWQDRKDAIRERIYNAGKLFINPYKKAADYQAALELVGDGVVKFNGAEFTPNLA